MLVMTKALPKMMSQMMAGCQRQLDFPISDN